jgi:hypothetical protein
MESQSRSFCRKKVLQWWKTSDFPWALTALKHSGGWSTSALYPYATRGRGQISLASKLLSSLKSAAGGPDSSQDPRVILWAPGRKASFLRFWDLGVAVLGVDKQEESRREHLFYPKAIFQMITQVCVVPLRTCPTSDTTSNATLSSSELRKVYHDTVLWLGKCYALHWCRSPCDQSCSMFASQPDSRFVSAARYQLCLPRQ